MINHNYCSSDSFKYKNTAGIQLPSLRQHTLNPQFLSDRSRLSPIRHFLQVRKSSFIYISAQITVIFSVIHVYESNRWSWRTGPRLLAGPLVTQPLGFVQIQQKLHNECLFSLHPVFFYRVTFTVLPSCSDPSPRVERSSAASRHFNLLLRWYFLSARVKMKLFVFPDLMNLCQQILNLPSCLFGVADFCRMEHH